MLVVSNGIILVKRLYQDGLLLKTKLINIEIVDGSSTSSEEEMLASIQMIAAEGSGVGAIPSDSASAKIRTPSLEKGTKEDGRRKITIRPHLNDSKDSAKRRNRRSIATVERGCYKKAVFGLNKAVDNARTSTINSKNAEGRIRFQKVVKEYKVFEVKAALKEQDKSRRACNNL